VFTKLTLLHSIQKHFSNVARKAGKHQWSITRASSDVQESPAIADKPARCCFRECRTVYQRTAENRSQ